MQYIILLRGINVGGRNLKMDELRICLEKNGYKDVITVLQTGNVILDTTKKDIEKLTRELENILSKTFDYPAKIISMLPRNLKSIIDNNPFKVNTDFHRYVIFTKNGFEKTLVNRVPELNPDEEKIKEGNGVVYWMVRKGATLDSIFAKYVAKMSTKEFITSRNMNTLGKILAKTNLQT